MVELKVPYGSKMEEANTYKREKILGLEQRAGNGWIQILDIAQRLALWDLLENQPTTLCANSASMARVESKSLRHQLRLPKIIPDGSGVDEMSSYFIIKELPPAIGCILGTNVRASGRSCHNSKRNDCRFKTQKAGA
ncbi:hypothetical protein PoB_002127600 [Plakobranchus ocellatus]|uniref:Uncharacterized protein n=1 Tax=Plakobranchus ocellatus TaxID=259542 RepID=A0AAV3ZFU8_9GAST|nr:hypothetical protein PoB_002127600 [Plakobranchus ocellatus]